jgi:hypothetical protein
MNLNSNPTKDQLRELLRHQNDYASHHLLWVNKNGDVALDRLPRDWPPAGLEEAHPDMQMRFEPFLAGNEYVGPEAAQDDEWLTELFDRLVTGWRSARGKPSVEYMDSF